MSRITFRTIMLVPTLIALVFSFNLFVGAQEKTTGANRDQDVNKSAKAGTGTLSGADKKFVMEAAHGGMMEVELGKIAAQKAMSEDVKQFAQRMVDYHGKANDELMQLASTKGITIDHHMGASAAAGGTESQTATASGTSGQASHASDDKAKMMMKHHDMINKMSALSGADFDRKYMEHMVKDHEKDVAAFERESNKGDDADVKAWAAKTLPTLREHLQMARDTAAKVKTSSKASSDSKSTNKNP
jgi:putative membrane protein